VSSLHDGWRNAVDRLEKYGHPRIRAALGLFLLVACTIGFISVSILVAVSGAERRSDYGAAVGGVIGAVFCVGMAVWMVSPRRDDRDDRGDGVWRFMDGRRWRALQVVSGAALVALGLLEVQRGNSEGWLMVAIAAVVVIATQGLLYFARRRRTP
jgi:peptidoglycan biosynthesis protein MviN/MurJ (putative lipid II flippase)